MAHVLSTRGVPDGTGGLVVPSDMDGARLVDVCWARMGAVARRAIGPLIAAGGVTVDGAHGRIAEVVHAGQRLDLTSGALASLIASGRVTPAADLPLRVVHEDHDVLVVDKPAGWHVHPMGPHREGTLLGAVLWRAGARPWSPWTDCRPAPAHRLDRPTSGLLVFARTIAARDALQGMLERHEVVRTYRARVEGVLSGEAGTIALPLGRDATDPRRRAATAVAAGGQQATTRWRVLRRDRATTLLSVRLETGRTHQIRAHLAHLGHPVVGDVDYGAREVAPPPDPASGRRIALRAVHLRLPHPSGTGTLEVSAGDHVGEMHLG